ncbi:tyrosine-type recombinase/integrase [Pseudohoeflea coraliihabitans]|uniref:Tyrosine-type recombinase/integrase n=1 Tax=Pseudohoeflea coraliihabitans TaxID=2860393 RepID=A0ABS6WKM2_9HYPH|nr:site-specific integrase [Pseudohoeflea sp. DP4N28-3]MBW3096493.1 tyrosine-type recombinase/integrase [Pseudohoeflea sp. DP4N28-3]
MAKSPALPRHVSQSDTGIYRYRRRVPEALRAELGLEVKRSLGRDYAKMLEQYAVLQAQVAKSFASKPHRQSNARQKVISKLREHGFQPHEVVSLVSSGADPDDMDGRFYAFDAALDELAREADLTPELIRAVSRGEIPMTMEAALDEYLEYRIRDAPQRATQSRQAVERHKALLRSTLGGTAFSRRPVQQLRRADARRVRDHLMERVAASTARRSLNDISAALRRAIREHDLDMANPFADLEVAGSQHTRSQRIPLDHADMARLAKIMETNDELGDIWITLRDTGARLSEIIGLRGMDLDAKSLLVRVETHDERRLKTANSEREIPIPAELAERLASRANPDDKAAPLFPRYQRPRGNDACSQALMKRLRRVIKDPRKVVYSLRHRMKDLLRDTDCPESLAREIMGHSDQSSAANYGRGSSLERKRRALVAAWTNSQDGTATFHG